ncbi:hypothetical protein BC628DRAFT_1374659 [Trametes gibbosa]|nr:hypothetical protein BC628DRAFT_1374659 [Trametes gibbosa]
MTVKRVYGQLWARTPQASDDDEHPPNTEPEECSSELSEMDSETSSDGESTPDTEMYDSEETKYDEEECYEFQRRDSVWVQPRGTSTWYQGVITRIRQPTEPSQQRKRGLLYLVVFRRYHANLRAWFSPLEGNMRPDTPRVRALVHGSS